MLAPNCKYKIAAKDKLHAFLDFGSCISVGLLSFSLRSITCPFAPHSLSLDFSSNNDVRIWLVSNLVNFVRN